MLLDEALRLADIIFHLAGVNRPQKEEEFHIGKIIEYQVRGEDYRVLDIPPGYTHSIENIGRVDLVTLLWASEMFDPAKFDTI